MRLIKVPLERETVTEAVSVAEDGDCIALSAGVHVLADTLRLTKRISIFGEEHEPTVLQLAPASLASGQGSPTIVVDIPSFTPTLPTIHSSVRTQPEFTDRPDPLVVSSVASSSTPDRTLRLSSLRIQASALSSAARRTSPPTAPCVVAVESGAVALDKVVIIGFPDATGTLHSTQGLQCVRVGKVVDDTAGRGPLGGCGVPAASPRVAFHSPSSAPTARVQMTGCVVVGAGVFATASGRRPGAREALERNGGVLPSCGVVVNARGEIVMNDSRLSLCDVALSVGDYGTAHVARSVISHVGVGVDAAPCCRVEVQRCDFVSALVAGVRAQCVSQSLPTTVPVLCKVTDTDRLYGTVGRSAGEAVVTQSLSRSVGGPGVGASGLGLEGTSAAAPVSIRTSFFSGCRVGVFACGVQVDVRRCRFDGGGSSGGGDGWANQSGTGAVSSPFQAGRSGSGANGGDGVSEAMHVAVLAVGRDGRAGGATAATASGINDTPQGGALGVHTKGRLFVGQKGTQTPHPAASLGVSVTHPLVDLRSCEIHNVRGVGVLVAGCAAARLSNCVSQRCCTAVSAEGLGAVVLVEGSTLSGCVEAAVLASGGARVGIEKTVVEDCDHGGVIVAGAPTVAVLRRSSVLRTLRAPGVRVVAGAAVTLSGCAIEQNDRGVVFEPSADLRRSAVVRTLIAASRSVGLSVGVVVQDRYVASCSKAVSIAAAAAGGESVYSPTHTSAAGAVDGNQAASAASAPDSFLSESGPGLDEGMGVHTGLAADLRISPEDQAADPIRSARYLRARTQVAEARAAASAQEEVALRELYLFDLDVLFVDVIDAFEGGGAVAGQAGASTGVGGARAAAPLSAPLVVRQCSIVDNGRVGLAVAGGAVVTLSQTSLRDNGSQDVRAEGGGAVLDEAAVAAKKSVKEVGDCSPQAAITVDSALDNAPTRGEERLDPSSVVLLANRQGGVRTPSPTTPAAGEAGEGRADAPVEKGDGAAAASTAAPPSPDKAGRPPPSVVTTAATLGGAAADPPPRSSPPPPDTAPSAPGSVTVSPSRDTVTKAAEESANLLQQAVVPAYVGLD